MAMLPGFIGPSYVSESISANSQRCVNFYLEQDPTGKQAHVLYGTPGLRVFVTLPDGPVRAIEQCYDSLLVVAGGGIYRVTMAGAITLLLAIGNNTQPVFVSQAGTNALIVDGQLGYWADWTGGVWTAGVVTDPGFPVKPQSCTAMDGYFITHTAGTQSWQISAPFDAKTWDAADVAAKEGQADPISRVIATYQLLYIIGTKTSEVWQDTGNVDFPFTRITGAFIEQGSPAPGTVRDIDGAVTWLGQSKVGSHIVWRMQGLSSVRISTHAVEQAIGSYGKVDDAYAWVYQDKGHAFYVLSFPTAKATWCFDITTQLWHERPYRNTTTGDFEHHRGTSHAFFNDQHVVGDRLSGKLYYLDRNVYSDDGDPLIALRTSPHVWKGGARGFISLLEFFFEAGVGTNDGQGVNPQVLLRVSKDGGRTFPIARSASLGRQGEYHRRARFNRLANARDMVMEVSISDPVKRVLIGANVEIA